MSSLVKLALLLANNKASKKTNDNNSLIDSDSIAISELEKMGVNLSRYNMCRNGGKIEFTLKR